MSHFKILFVLIFFGCATSQVKAEAVWQALYKSAVDKKLDQDPQWLNLLHYHRHFGKLKSDIDGGYFFLSPEGKTNSRAEMAATLKAFFANENLAPPMDSGMQAAEMHPLVKFRARLHFFKDRLEFPDSLLPPIDCSRFLKWKSSLHPQSASLIFASSYLNNPASMFGHTFLRLNTFTKDSVRAILNYGITYSATVPESDGFSFMFKGVFGSYRGAYGIVPYFVSLQKYSHLESRDIWEYDLKLDSTQLDYLLEHIWEVGACFMHYYFFDENCSYNIITLLDAVSPNFQLTRSLDKSVVIPAETVKLLLRNQELIGDLHWRPSLLNSFRLNVARLPHAQKQILKKLIFNGVESVELSTKKLSGDTLAQVTDIALDYIQYRKRKAKAKNVAHWSDRQRELLLLRSKLPLALQKIDLERDRKSSPPQLGHAAHLFSVQVGAEDYGGYTELGYRLAYHDFNANEMGFLSGSQIETLNFKLRFNCGNLCNESQNQISKNHLEIEKVDILNIMSISPIDFIQKTMSWAVRVGYENRPYRSIYAGGNLLIEGGAGFALESQNVIQIRPYFLLQGKAMQALEQNGELALGPQIKLGMKIDFHTKSSLWIENRTFASVIHQDGIMNDLWMELRQSLNKDADIRFSVLHQEGIGTFGLTYNQYF